MNFKSAKKTKPVRLNEATIRRVKKAIKDAPHMSISRFYDEAANEKLARDNGWQQIPDHPY